MRKLGAGVLVGCVALAGCRLSTPSTPAACEEERGSVATIAVNRDGIADPECLEVMKGNTTVLWSGGRGVRELHVKFKPGQPDPPDDPECDGPACVLEKAKHAMKEGTFPYTVEVVRNNGTRVEVDPRLIIDP